MNFGKPKSKGTARSAGSVEHGPANSDRQRDDQLLQVRGRAEAINRALDELTPERMIARRVLLTIKQEREAAREEEEKAIQDLDLGFNFDTSGQEISDAEDKRLVRSAEKTQFYWKLRGGERAEEWKSVPLGGYMDRKGGQSSSSPVWYFATNMSQWNTWAVIDGTRAGLDGKAFLKEVMTRHATWSEEFTQHRLVCGQCHQKPHNIHAQNWLSVIGPAIPNPGVLGNAIDPDRQTGVLLGRPDMKGHGRSPMRFSFLGKTGCSLANLRRAGYDICALTGDPQMDTKLDSWIERRKRNRGVVLDLESEAELERIVKSIRAVHPEWEPFFETAWKRHQGLKAKELGRVMEEIAKTDTRGDIHDLRARTEAEETENESSSAQLIHEDVRTTQPKNKQLSEQLSSTTQKPVTRHSVNFDARSRIAAMGDALRRTLAGVDPTEVDRLFLVACPKALGGFRLAAECSRELIEALKNAPLCVDAEATRAQEAIALFTDFAAAFAALENGQAKYAGNTPSRFLDETGCLEPLVVAAANAATSLALQFDHPRYTSSWADWAHAAMSLLESATNLGKERGGERGSKDLT